MGVTQQEVLKVYFLVHLVEQVLQRTSHFSRISNVLLVGQTDYLLLAFLFLSQKKMYTNPGATFTEMTGGIM